MRSGWIVVVVLVAACGGDDAGGPAVRFDLPESGVPAPLAVPWPSDVYRSDADGTIVEGLTDWSLAKVDNAEPSALLSQYGAVDGFGLLGGVVFSIQGLGEDEAIDPATFGGDPKPYAMWNLDTGTEVACSIGWDAYVQAITVIPDAPLAPGQRYAAALYQGIQTTAGKALAASSQLARLRGGSASGAAETLYRDAIAEVPRDKEKLVAFTVYTTQTTYKGLRILRDRLASGAYGAAPTLQTTTAAAPYKFTRFGSTTHPGWTATLDEWLGTPRRDTNGADLPGLPGAPEPESTGIAHDSIAAVVSGSYVSPFFPRAFAKTAAYDDGTIAYDTSGVPVPANATAQVPVTFAIPKGSPPAAGWPVVIFQHGLGADRFVMFAVANELARAGIATAAIEVPVHGMRQGIPTDDVSNGKGTYRGADGFADSFNALAQLDFNGNLRSLLRARDLNWQGVLDLVQLRRLIGNVDLVSIADEFGGAAPKLDASHVGFIGMSMGGQMGVMLSSVEPRSSIDPFVFDVPPSLTTEIFTESPSFNAQLPLIAAGLNVRAEVVDAGVYSAFIQVTQAGLDAIDTTVFAPDAAAEHNLWFLAGANDETVPRRSSEWLARSLGATQVLPRLREISGLATSPSPLRPGTSGRVVGYFEAAPGNHDHLLSRFADLTYEPPFPRAMEPRFPKLAAKVRIRQSVVGAQRAVIAFITSVWAGAPKIDVTDPAFLGLLPVADFDDDGYCDDAERAAGTDPYSTSSMPSGTPTCQRDLGFTR